jgi:hypothetical protein
MNKQEVMQRVQEIADEADCIMKLFQTDHHVPRAKVQEARELLRALKEKLQSEYKRMDTFNKRETLSDVESAFYQPAIASAWANSGISGISPNTTPTYRWFSALYCVRHDMGHTSSQLEDVQSKM